MAQKAFAADLDFPYELVAAAQTAQILGSVGGAGDVLHAVIVKANTGTITVLDGAVVILVIPAATAVGTRFVFNAKAVTNWNITTPAATEAMCMGRFT
jgi:hypothetical protein